MAGKNRKRTSNGTEPARHEKTDAAYRKRYTQLVREAAAQLGGTPTPERLAGWLIEAKRPTLSKSSWRQIRAATVFGFGIERDANPELATTIDAAIGRLKSTAPAKLADAPLRTSQQKAKRFLPGDLDRIAHRALSTPSPNAIALTNYLTASNTAGLRPCEWPNAEFRPSAVPAFRWEMKVLCAKSDDIRAHSEFRTLRWEYLEPETVSAITDWISQARAAEANNIYGTLVATLQALMLRVTSSLFPRREKHPTLYTPRHEAIARWKAVYVDPAATREERLQGLAIVAALSGHASDATATAHYGRPRQGESRSSRFPIPVADPDEVARVRRRLQQDLDRLATRQPPQGHQP